MWITVEKQRIFGDIALGISKPFLKGSRFSLSFPQRSPQMFINASSLKKLLVRKVICNYKSVILLTHLLTAVITTNFKYKNLSQKVPSVSFHPVFSLQTRPNYAKRFILGVAL